EATTVAAAGGATTAAATTAAATQAADAGANGASGADGPYAEPVHFTFANLGDDTLDYSNDIIYQEYSERFNFTWEIYTMIWDNWGEKTRLWINAGDMPDIVYWNFNYAEYLQYVDAGMLGALPAGWEANYPNVNDVQLRTGIKDYVVIDGTQYALPRATFYHFSPVDTLMYHGSCIYRPDWLEALGMDPWEDGGMITLEQFKEYINGAINNNPDGLPASSVTGLTDTYALVCRLIVSMGDEGYNTFYLRDGQYIWGPTTEGTLEGIRLLRELYQGGYIDPDFYMITDKVHGDKFNAGTAAMFFDDMTAGSYAGYIRSFGDANPELGDPNDHISLVNILAPDGKWHGTQSANWWSAMIFHPSLEAVKMERALALFDYTATLEGQEQVRMGIEGVDFIKHGKGDYELIRPQNENGMWPSISSIYPSLSMLNSFVINGDDFNFANPETLQRAKDVTAKQYKNKELMGSLLPYDYDWQFYSSPVKSNYSGSLINDEIVRIAIGTGDIESEWQVFIDSMKGTVDPLLEELNTVLIN
ncbi:MAG: extracellular solute-binding protein, partial [Oscillospiraceae bacterium]|nr:extracellular solute-binding protein [Oscillospiraceae bacterium]